MLKQFRQVISPPIIIKFSKPLSKERFDYFVKLAFDPISSAFGLWGNPIVLGPQKIQVYGVAKELWKPIYLELTDIHLVVIMPNGICRKTIDRLISNIQRYIDQRAKAYIGDKEYKDIIDESSGEIIRSN